MIRRVIVTLLALLALAPHPRSAAQGAHLPEWRFAAVTSYGGTTDGDDEIGDARGWVVLPSGTLLVADRRSQQIKVYDAGGRFLRTVGREGGGPGEFAELNGLTLGPDGRIWVSDPGNARLTVFDRQLKLVQSRPWATSFAAVWDGAFDDQGRLVIMNLASRGALLVRWNPLSAAADTIANRECTPVPAPSAVKRGWTFVRRDGRGGSSMGIPFTAGRVAAIDPAGYQWCAYNGTYTVYRLRLGGQDTAAIIHGESTHVRIPSVIRDSAVEQGRKLMTQYGSGDFAESDVPTFYPAIKSLLVDDMHRLWVQLPTAEPNRSRFDIYAATGVKLATATLPTGLMRGAPVVFHGAAVYIVTTDSDGIEHITKYAVVKPSG